MIKGVTKSLMRRCSGRTVLGLNAGAKMSLFRAFCVSQSSIYTKTHFQKDFPSICSLLDQMSTDLKAKDPATLLDQNDCALLMSSSMLLAYRRHTFREIHDRSARRSCINNNDIDNYVKIIDNQYISMNANFKDDVKVVIDVVGIDSQAFFKRIVDLCREDADFNTELKNFWHNLINTSVENPEFNPKNLSEARLIELLGQLTEYVGSLNLDKEGLSKNRHSTAAYINDMIALKFDVEIEDLMLETKKISLELLEALKNYNIRKQTIILEN